jgi:hypothetical protein
MAGAGAPQSKESVMIELAISKKCKKSVPQKNKVVWLHKTHCYNISN